MNIRDLPFSPLPDHGIARGQAEDLWKKEGQKKGTANFIVAGEKLTARNFNLGCHYNIAQGTRQGPGGDKPSIVLTEVAIVRASGGDLKVQDDMRFFLNWFLKDSHFGRFVLNRDEVITDYVIISADIPAPLLQNMCIITRHFYECNHEAFAGFRKMVEGGTDGHITYSIWFNTNLSFKFSSPTLRPTQVLSESGHRAWSLWRDTEAFKNFVNGEFGKAISEQQTYREHQTIFGGVSYCYTKPYTPNAGCYRDKYFTMELMREDENFKKELLKLRKAVPQPEPEIRNPFLQQARPSFKYEDHVVTKEEMMEFVIPYMKEKGHFDAVSS